MTHDPPVEAVLGDQAELIDQVRARVRGLSALDVPGTGQAIRLKPRGGLLRAHLTLAAARTTSAAGPVPFDTGTAVAAAASMECLHLASLVHDDVMDRSQLRRGEPTLSTTHGDAVAIAFGDILVARSAAAGVRAGNGVIDRWPTTLEALCVGQLREPALMAGSPADRVECATLKTGALMGFAAEAGALSQGAGTEASQSWSDAGLAFGLGYQFADDMLDHIGDPVRLGKPIHADLPRGIISKGTRGAAERRGLRVEELSLDRLHDLARAADAIEDDLELVSSQIRMSVELIEPLGGLAVEALRSVVVRFGRVLVSRVADDHRSRVRQAVGTWG